MQGCTLRNRRHASQLRSTDRPHNVHYKNVIARYFVLCRLYLRDKEQDDIGNVYHIKKLETDSEQGQEELDVSKTLLNLEHKLKITKTPF